MTLSVVVALFGCVPGVIVLFALIPALRLARLYRPAVAWVIISISFPHERQSLENPEIVKFRRFLSDLLSFSFP